MGKIPANDPWCEMPTETIDIGGVKVDVRGLSVGEANAITKAHEKDTQALGLALICECCTRQDGVKLTPESLGKIRPDVLLALDAAVSRVNGVKSGNSSATGADN